MWGERAPVREGEEGRPLRSADRSMERDMDESGWNSRLIRVRLLRLKLGRTH